MQHKVNVVQNKSILLYFQVSQAILDCLPTEPKVERVVADFERGICFTRDKIQLKFFKIYLFNKTSENGEVNSIHKLDKARQYMILI